MSNLGKNAESVQPLAIGFLALATVVLLVVATQLRAANLVDYATFAGWAATLTAMIAICKTWPAIIGILSAVRSR